MDLLLEEKPKFVVHSGGKEQKEEEETSKLGSVSKDVYFGYIKNGGNEFSALALFLLTIGTFGAHSFWGSQHRNQIACRLTLLRVLLPGSLT